jgi:hypothetical protein
VFVVIGVGEYAMFCIPLHEPVTQV